MSKDSNKSKREKKKPKMDKKSKPIAATSPTSLYQPDKK